MVRAGSVAEGLNRIYAKLEEQSLLPIHGDEEGASRVHAICGDTSLPDWGISETDQVRKEHLFFPVFDVRI